MKTVTLRFNNLENLGRFIQQQDGGYYTNTRMLTVKGTFPEQSVASACVDLGAEVIEPKH